MSRPTGQVSSEQARWLRVGVVLGVGEDDSVLPYTGTTTQKGADSGGDTLRRMSSQRSPCPWGKSFAPTEECRASMREGGAEPRPYDELSLPGAVQPGMALDDAVVGGTHRSRPTNGSTVSP